MTKRRNNYKEQSARKRSGDYEEQQEFHSQVRYDNEGRKKKRPTKNFSAKSEVVKSDKVVVAREKPLPAPKPPKYPVVEDWKSMPKYLTYIPGEFTPLAHGYVYNHNVPSRANFYSDLYTHFPASKNKFTYQPVKDEGWLAFKKDVMHENFHKGKPSDIWIHQNCWIHGKTINGQFINSDFTYNPMPGSEVNNIPLISTIRAPNVDKFLADLVQHGFGDARPSRRDPTNFVHVKANGTAITSSKMANMSITWVDFMAKCDAIASDRYGNHVWGTASTMVTNSQIFVGRYYAGRVFPCPSCMKGKCKQRSFEFRFVDWRRSNQLITDDILSQSKQCQQLVNFLKEHHPEVVVAQETQNTYDILVNPTVENEIPRGGGKRRPAQKRMPNKKQGDPAPQKTAPSSPESVKQVPKKQVTKPKKKEVPQIKIFYGNKVTLSYPDQALSAIDPGALDNTCGFRAIALLTSDKPVIWGKTHTDIFMKDYMAHALPLFMDYERAGLWMNKKLAFNNFSSSALELALYQLIRFGKIIYNIYSVGGSYGHVQGTSNSLLLHQGHWYSIKGTPVHCPKPQVVMLPAWATDPIEPGSEGFVTLIYNRYAMLSVYLTALTKGATLCHVSKPFTELYSSSCFGYDFKLVKANVKDMNTPPDIPENFMLRYPFQTRLNMWKEIVFRPPNVDKPAKVETAKPTTEAPKKVETPRVPSPIETRLAASKAMADLLLSSKPANVVKLEEQNPAAVKPTQPTTKASASDPTIPPPNTLPKPSTLRKHRSVDDLFGVSEDPIASSLFLPISPPVVPSSEIDDVQDVYDWITGGFFSKPLESDLNPDQAQVPPPQAVVPSVSAPQPSNVATVPDAVPPVPAQQSESEQQPNADAATNNEVVQYHPLMTLDAVFEDAGEVLDVVEAQESNVDPGEIVQFTPTPLPYGPVHTTVIKTSIKKLTPVNWWLTNQSWEYFGCNRPIPTETTIMEPPKMVKLLSRFRILKARSLEAYVPQIFAASVNDWASKHIKVESGTIPTLLNCFHATWAEAEAKHLNAFRRQLRQDLVAEGYVLRNARNQTTLPNFQSRKYVVSRQVVPITHYDDINRNFRLLSPYRGNSYTLVTERAELYMEHNDATYVNMLNKMWQFVNIALLTVPLRHPQPRTLDMADLARSLMAWGIRLINPLFFYNRVTYSYPEEVLVARVTSMGDLRKMSIDQWCANFQTSVKTVLSDLPNSSKGMQMLDDFFIAARVAFEVHRDKQIRTINAGRGDINSLVPKNLPRG